MPPSEDSPTVFVVDDDVAVRESLAALVKTMGISARTFESAEEFLASRQPDIYGCLVTDLRLKGASGLELLSQLQRQRDPLPVIVVTAFADVPATVQAMKAGALTVLEKPCREQQLWDALRECLAIGQRRQERLRRLREVQARLGRLTPEERQVLDLAIAGVPNKNIAQSLKIGLRTVEKRRHNVFAKMEVDSLPALVRLVLSGEEDGHAGGPRGL